jgi:ABC-type nitrate/sulfonate/bicarbonate transport system substrate-binding protein
MTERVLRNDRGPTALAARGRGMTRLWSLVAVAALLVAPARAAERVTLAQNLSPISGVTIVAKQRGLFLEHGLDVQVSNFTTGKQCLDTVIGGAAEIATTAEAPTTAAAMAGQPIAFLARTEYSDLKTLASVASGIAKPADLKGKRLAFTAGTGGEVYTATLLRNAGLGLDDVKLVNLRPQDMVAALSNGSIDAYNTWEPHIGNGKKALGDQVRELDTKGVYSETFNIVVMQDFLKSKPQLVRGFLAALLEAEAWMTANREDAIGLVAETVNMPRADLATLWSSFVYGVTLDQRTLDILNAHARWRLESGNHPPGAQMPDWSKVIVAEPLRGLAPDRVKIAGF